MDHWNKSILIQYHVVHATASGRTRHWAVTIPEGNHITHQNIRQAEYPDHMEQKARGRRHHEQEAGNPFPYNPIPERGLRLRNLRRKNF